MLPRSAEEKPPVYVGRNLRFVMLALLVFMVFALGSAFMERQEGVPQDPWSAMDILKVCLGFAAILFMLLTPYERFSAEGLKKVRLLSSKTQDFAWDQVEAIKPSSFGNEAEIHLGSGAQIDLKGRYVRSGNPVWDHIRRAVPESRIDPIFIQLEKRRKMFWE